MTRGKPLIFSQKAGSSRRERRKRQAEAGWKSGELPRKPPAELKDAPAGRAAWRALLRAHDQLPGDIFNLLDRGFLIGYCLAVQSRARALELERKISGLFDEEKAPLQDLLKVRTELRMATRLVADLEKQLFATPKARGGVAPPARQPTPEEVIAHELEALDDLFEDG